jgi:hypothetical protein
MTERQAYYVASEADMRCYPNYSLQVADVDGDGRMEIIVAGHNGNRLRVVDIHNRILFERKLHNNGNWGTLPVCCVDLNGDGRDEIVVPDTMKGSEPVILVLNAAGEQLGCCELGETHRDDFGLCVPLLSPFRHSAKAGLGIVAAVAGGTVVALDAELHEVWRVDTLRENFGHEFFASDIDGDGADELWFCTVDSIGSPYSPGGSKVGELVVLDHDGTLLLRRRVDSYYPDNHFDDIKIADFLGNGTNQLLLEKGILLDLEGRVLWDRSEHFGHGQWIAHVPAASGKGRTIMISELWGPDVRGALLSGSGELLRELRGLPPMLKLDSEHAGWRVLPTRCHAIEWKSGGGFEFFMAEQALSPTSHDCFRTVHFELRCYFYDTSGQLLGVMPFADAQVEGFWYNGEVRSWVGDVDGDGETEIVFPRQEGKVMILKKHASGSMDSSL